jgi:hypothetical protein
MSRFDAIAARLPVRAGLHGTGAVLLLCVAVLPATSLGRAAAASETERFRIVCHFECGGIAADAAHVAEAAWPLAGELFGPARRERARPMEIHLYRTPEQYVAARTTLLRGPPVNMAVTEPHSRSAHIALPAGVADTTLNAFGLPGTVLRVVAHEAFHLAALAHAPGSTRLPGWLVEGAASWAEHEVLRALGRVAEAADEPVASTYQWLVQQRLRAGELPAAAQILADSLPGHDQQDEYAVRKLFFEFLRESDRAELLEAAARAGSLHAERRSLLGRLPTRGAVRDVVDLHLLGDEPAAALDLIDDAFATWVAALRPAWVQSGRALDRLDEDRWLQVGLSGHATAWRTRYAPAVELRGTVGFLTPGSAQLHIDSSGEGYFSITFDRAAARLWLAHSTAAPGDAPILDVPLNMLHYGEITFLLVARRGMLRLDIEGEAPRTLDVPALEPNGGWGLGAGRGTSIVWAGLSDQPDGGAGGQR